MNLKMKKVVAAFAMAGFSAAASAAGGIGVVSEITITGGDFNMGGDYSTGACGAAGPFGSWQCITGGATIDTDDGAFEGPSLTTFNFFGAPVTTFTAATATGAAPSVTGNPIEGTTTASSITLDFGSFYAQWSGTNFLQAPAAGTVVGSYDSATGAFDVSWSSYITTAPFADQTGYWHLTGTATAAAVIEPPVGVVPEASTYGMMLAGLGLVGFAVRRRRVA
jgi:hypothetical protein